MRGNSIVYKMLQSFLGKWKFTNRSKIFFEVQLINKGILKLKPQISTPTRVKETICYNSITKKHYGFDRTNWKNTTGIIV